MKIFTNFEIFIMCSNSFILGGMIIYSLGEIFSNRETKCEILGINLPQMQHMIINGEEKFILIFTLGDKGAIKLLIFRPNEYQKAQEVFQIEMKRISKYR